MYHPFVTPRRVIQTGYLLFVMANVMLTMSMIQPLNMTNYTFAFLEN